MTFGTYEMILVLSTSSLILLPDAPQLGHTIRLPPPEDKEGSSSRLGLPSVHLHLQPSLVFDRPYPSRQLAIAQRLEPLPACGSSNSLSFLSFSSISAFKSSN